MFSDQSLFQIVLMENNTTLMRFLYESETKQVFGFIANCLDNFADNVVPTVNVRNGKKQCMCETKLVRLTV